MNRIEREKQAVVLSPQGVYTFREASEILHVSSPTLKKFIRMKMIRANKLGGRWFITGKAILDALDGKTRKGLNPTATK